METPSTPNQSRGKVMAGLLLLGVGTVLLFERLGYWFPHWLFSWPMILIVVGLFIGFKHNFRHPAWFILIVVGGLFLAESFYVGLHVKQFIWPVMIMLFGIWMIFGRHRHPRWNKENWHNRHRRDPWQNPNINTPGTSKAENTETTNPKAPKTEENSDFFSAATEDDFIDTVSIFGGTKRIVLSKNFKGGDIVTMLGGAEINLSQADIHGRAVLEVTQIMGGTRIIVPSNWEVKSEMAAIFGGIEDKRIIQPGSISPNKVLVIKGTSVFGGIDIRSF